MAVLARARDSGGCDPGRRSVNALVSVPYLIIRKKGVALVGGVRAARGLACLRAGIGILGLA